jgi:hypothetical protein
LEWQPRNFAKVYEQWNLTVKRQEMVLLARLVYFSKEGVTDFFGALVKVGE